MSVIWDPDFWPTLCALVHIHGSDDDDEATSTQRKRIRPRAPPRPRIKLLPIEPAKPRTDSKQQQQQQLKILPLSDLQQLGKCSDKKKNTPEFREDPLADAKLNLQELLRGMQLPVLTLLGQPGHSFTQEQLRTMLGQCTAELPMQTAELEDQLRVEAGEYFTASGHMKRLFPGCVNQNDCKTKRDWGWVMRQWMTAEELKRFEEQGTLPVSRPCVVCHSYKVCSLVFAIADQGKNVQLDPKESLFQQFTNLTDCPGGYLSEQCIRGPGERGFQGLYGALLQYRKCNFKECTVGNLRCLDASLVKWQTPVAAVPEIGETLQDFQ